MRILVAGNSHAGCVKRAYDQDENILNRFGDIFFYVTPGGTGPYFKVCSDGLLEVSVNLPNHPAYYSPDSTPYQTIESFDVIVICALGRVHGGVGMNNPLTEQGLIHRFGPKPNSIISTLISETCCREIVEQGLEQHEGTKFLRQLRDYTSVPIIVQPFPFYSEAVVEEEAWQMNILYENSSGANRFYCGLRDEFLKRICSELNVELLDYPETEWSKKCFTPRQFVYASDFIHPIDEYGRLFLKQVAQKIESFPSARQQ